MGNCAGNKAGPSGKTSLPREHSQEPKGKEDQETVDNSYEVKAAPPQPPKAKRVLEIPEDEEILSRE